MEGRALCPEALTWCSPHSYHLTLQVGTAGLRQAGWRVQVAKPGDELPWGLRAGSPDPDVPRAPSLQGSREMISCPLAQN